MLLCAMEIGQRTTQELVSQEESDGRDIDAFVQQLHGEGMPEAVERDMLVNTGRLYELRDFVIEDIRRKGREDSSLLPDRPQNGNGLFRKRNTNAIPSLLDGDTHVIASLLSFQVFPSETQQISSP